MDGNSTRIYGTPRWKALRREIVKRDGYVCTCCGASVRGKGQSRVDHIQPVKEAPALAWQPSNLRTLCPRCDNMRHAEKGGNQQQRPEVDAEGYPAGWR